MYCESLIWQPYDPLYQMLHFVKEYLVVFVIVLAVVGWAVITYHYMAKPLHYLDDVIRASEKLANLSEEQIILPEDLKEVQDELNGVKDAALRSAREAKEADQRKNDLIMYLAHDLKTPLSSVIGYLTLLRDEQQISPKLREKYQSIALDKAQRLEDLINEFFEITRLNLSHITLQYSTINLTRLLEQLTYEFQPMLKEKNLTCILEAKEEIMLRCDGDKLQRVFDNLLRNAVIYSFADSEIRIEAQTAQDHAVIRFSNHGDTIPEEKLSRLFEQFYRLDSSRSSQGGAGLGLAIAKQIVELHQGTIKAQSADDVIEFTVDLPLSRDGIFRENPAEKTDSHVP